MVSTVLLVDDDPLMHSLYQHHLRNAGYLLVSAACAEEALEKIAEWRPSIIVMDIQMPGMTGIAALFELKRKIGTRSIPVILLTAMTNYRLGQDGAKAVGADSFLTKPVSPTRLVEEINRLMLEAEALACRKSPAEDPSPSPALEQLNREV
jgi:two-component system, chemotaxis family, response regulator PixH